jgi:hypothetical protein
MPESPQNIPETPAPVASLSESIKALANDRKITRDQERISSSVLENPEYALLANRVMNQGADPESLRLIDPASFKALGEKLGLDEAVSIQAIQTAHGKGPAALADGSKEEALWLILASLSLDESSGTPMAERLIHFGDSLRQLKALSQKDADELMEIAKVFRAQVIEENQPIGKTAEGIPIYKGDFGFFSAYRSKFKAAIVQAEGYDAVGTTPDTTLEEQNLSVDKKLSPQFGLRFKK